MHKLFLHLFLSNCLGKFFSSSAERDQTERWGYLWNGTDAFSEDNFIKSELRGDIRLGLASPEIRYSDGFN